MANRDPASGGPDDAGNPPRSSPKPGAAAETPAHAREARLAEALRANLRRRKQAARASKARPDEKQDG